MSIPSIHIPVLYGSQTGNSQSCAESLAKSLPSTLYKSFSSSNIKISSSAKELDDFLEVDRANWPRLVIIVCSSYGVGQAPLGCWKFRELCDAILESDENDGTLLKGVKYAMLGLGDSKYTTFFLNPTALDTALSKAGAERIGSLGKADASGVGDKLQGTVMEQWSENIIPEVSRAVQLFLAEGEEDKKSIDEALENAKDATCRLCKKLFDDWEESGKVSEKKNSNNNLMILIGIAAILMAFFMKKE
jgi:sulfite reductase alpha subunit-like flavoprotein